jgi:hypothetical protein
VLYGGKRDKDYLANALEERISGFSERYVLAYARAAHPHMHPPYADCSIKALLLIYILILIPPHAHHASLPPPTRPHHPPPHHPYPYFLFSFLFSLLPALYFLLYIALL